METTLYSVLDGLDISYEVFEHPAAFTVEEAERVASHIPGGRSKNLFLRNKKGDQHFLVSADTKTNIDIQAFGKQTGLGHLSFASSDRLMHHLGVTPGSVTPFSLINNTDHTVRVFIDNRLMKHTCIGFHPNRNTATIVVRTDDFRKFLEWSGHEVLFVDF